jgi:hypothetical protein
MPGVIDDLQAVPAEGAVDVVGVQDHLLGEPEHLDPRGLPGDLDHDHDLVIGVGHGRLLRYRRGVSSRT